MRFLTWLTTRRRMVAALALLMLAWSLTLNNAVTARAAGADESEDSFYAGRTGAVYTLTNSTTGNAVAVYDRAVNGQLNLSQYVFTRGNGTGAGLGSQGALVREGRWLVAVNAASNSISALRIEPYGLRLTDTISSGGERPISVALHKGLVYALNAGADGNITGFRLSENGKLSQLAGATQPLSASGVNPAQVSFSPNGRFLVVSEKGTNRLDTYQVEAEGRVTNHKVFNAPGQTPFGFTFDGNNRVLVTEAFGGAANASAVSSYQLSSNGDLSVISASVPTHQTAACWIVASKNGNFVYSANPGSDSLSGYTVARDGKLSLLNADGRTGSTTAGSSPEDEAISRDGQFLYVLDIRVGKVSAFKVEGNGQLTALADFGGLPVGSVGLAAS